jgi:pimeloyl-ACP methyl ester carboxylesterase
MDCLVDGRKVYAGTGGTPFDASKPAIVFIHGAGLDHTCWQLQSRWFAWHGWSVLAVDLPGHGRSDGPPLESVSALSDWVLALLGSAGLARASLVGHSMGAVIALETAARAPQRVDRLALLGISSAMPVHPALLEAATSNPDRAYDMMTGWCFANSARIGGNSAPGLWMTGSARALLGRGREGTLAADLALCGAWSSAPKSAAAVLAPTILVLGDSDVMTPARKGQELAMLISDSTVVTLKGCGHMMMQERPDATLDALIGHFGGARATHAAAALAGSRPDSPASAGHSKKDA